MSVIWHKVWFDLWHNKVRTLLAVLSIGAGVFGIGAMFGMSDQLLSGMDQAHQAVRPSHINMFLNTRIDRNTALSLRNIPGVEDIEPYNRPTVQYKIHPEDDWKQGALVRIDDYEHQKYDLVQLKEGRWPKKDDIGIERLSSQYFKVDIGDKVIFKIGNTEKSLPISGKIRHPFVPPPQFNGPAYFFVNGAGLERFGVPDGEFGALLIRVTPYSADHAKEVATAIKDRLAKEKISISGTVYQDPQKHWGRMYVEGITVVMQVLAVVSLFLSVVLVFNTLSALITQQTNQIGMIKAIGGRSTTIMQVYLATVLAYGLLALLISLPLGMFLAFGITQSFLNLFNIDYVTFRVSSQAIVLQVLAATAVPLLAGLIPVLQGAAITVREAIATYGLGADFGSSGLDRVVERIGQRLLPSHYATALGNMFRRKGRLILTQLVLITAGALFLMVMSLTTSITLTLDKFFERRQFDTTLSFRENHRIDHMEEMAQSIAGVDKVQVQYIHSAAILKEGKHTKEAGVGVDIVGVPAGSDFERQAIVAGRWLQPGDGRIIVMSRDTADKNSIKVGDTVTLDLAEFGKSNWQVIGLYQTIFGGGFNMDSLYAPQDAVFDAVKKYNQGALLYVRTSAHDAVSVNAVTTQLKNLYEGRNMKTGNSQTEAEIRQSAWNQFSIVTSMLLTLAIIVAVVGGIGLMGALSISVVERTKEIGVLRAVGARSGTITSMFVMEGVLQGLLSWLIALPLSLVISPFMSNAMGQAIFSMNLDYQYSYQAVVIWLVIVLIISTLASILPARNATRISVRASLAYA
jgi:putative ABC transport system permease protein